MLKLCMLFTWARSPSYLNSHVNFRFSKRSRISVKLFVGCANIGLSGMPGGSMVSFCGAHASVGKLKYYLESFCSDRVALL